MKAKDHNRIITAAAKVALSPIGCFQKGHSRTWLDDHVWWVGVIEFQPSAWSKGSYLNVGACWLWYEKDHLSFDDGSRVAPFHPVESIEQFEESALLLAEHAKTETMALRKRFPSISATAMYLGLREPNTLWGQYHAGVSAGLIGDSTTAKERFKLVAEEKTEFDWVQELKKRAAILAKLAEDTSLFRFEISSIVQRTREKLKLPKLTVNMQFRSEPSA